MGKIRRLAQSDPKVGGVLGAVDATGMSGTDSQSEWTTEIPTQAVVSGAYFRKRGLSMTLCPLYHDFNLESDLRKGHDNGPAAFPFH